MTLQGVRYDRTDMKVTLTGPDFKDKYVMTSSTQI